MARGGGSKGISALGGQSGFSQHRDEGTLRDGVGGVECMDLSSVGSVVRGAFRGFGNQSRDESWGTTAQGWTSPGTELIGL